MKMSSGTNGNHDNNNNISTVFFNNINSTLLAFLVSAEISDVRLFVDLKPCMSLHAPSLLFVILSF